MHYAIVTETWPPEVNGVALTVCGLVDGLRRRGHAVSVVRPRQPEDGAAMQATLLVRAGRLPRYPGLRFGWPSTRALLRQWTQSRPDALYIATEGPLGWSALRAAARLGIPAATGFHTRFDRYMRDYGLGALEGPALRWMRAFHNRGAATIVPTRELETFLREADFAAPVRVPRAVDASLFDPARRDPALRAQWGIAGEALAVVHVGRIAPEKNLGLAIAGFRALQRVRPDARFVWVGDGPERERLQRSHPDFVFRGVQRGEALAAHFASADLFLFPSRSETFGNVTLEAMASGVPTIAFDYGAAREHLRGGEHGLAVADGDDAGFVAASVQLAGDEPRRRAMGIAARAAVQALRPDAVAAAYDAVLHDLAFDATGELRHATS